MRLKEPDEYVSPWSSSINERTKRQIKNSMSTREEQDVNKGGVDIDDQSKQERICLTVIASITSRVLIWEDPCLPHLAFLKLVLESECAAFFICRRSLFYFLKKQRNMVYSRVKSLLPTEWCEGNRVCEVHIVQIRSSTSMNKGNRFPTKRERDQAQPSPIERKEDQTSPKACISGKRERSLVWRQAERYGFHPCVVFNRIANRC